MCLVMHCDTPRHQNNQGEGIQRFIWKSKIMEQTDGVIDVLDADMKMACRIDSLSMVDIIVPNVLSFLHGEAN